jgi:hypothetical protein
MSLSVGTNYIGNVIILLAISKLAAWSQCGLLVILSINCLIAWAFTYKFVPETRGRSLEQISAEFSAASKVLEGESSGTAEERASLTQNNEGSASTSLMTSPLYAVDSAAEC